MKVLKRVGKKAIIIYMIIYLLLSSLSSCYARKYDEQCGEYISQYARDFIEKYCTPTETKTRYVLISHARWTGGDFGKGIFEACCNTGVRYMYELALGVELADYGWQNSCSADCYGLGNYPDYWEDVTNQTIKPGDIVLSTSHTEMYIGNNENANFGNSPHAGKIANGPRLGSSFVKAYRPKFDVNPTGSIPVEELEDEDLSIYDDNGFIYKGVASIESYESSSTLLGWIIDLISQIVDYLIGILTLGIRVVIVGWTAIIERFFIDGIVNAVTGVTNKRDEGWVQNPDEIDEIDEQAEADEAAEEEREAEENPPQDIGSQDNPNEYISTGMQAVSDIGGNVQLKTSSKANVTIENIVYNKIPILDINFFDFEQAGGAVVDEDGIIYIIKENVAMWYYIFRIIAILIMLLALIYLGLKMAISTVAEKKAVYKEMLISWIVGFLIVFTINYIMFAIIHINESLISWVIPEYEDGTEISLYETVRTKAYSLKATTGFTGMIMYIILVYYSIRFLIMYFKRFLIVTILALMSPFVAVSYAIEKINKKGKGGDIYSNWFKDFLYSVIIQAIHAIIYTIFISTAIKLSESSLTGIFIAFIFLHFMVRVDKIVRKIFGLDAGKSAGKIALGNIKVGTSIAKQAEKYTGGIRKVGGMYGNYLGKTVGRPLGKLAGRAGDAIDNLRNSLQLEDEDVEIDEEEQKKRKKEQAEKKARRKDALEQAVLGTKAAGSAIATLGSAALIIPTAIAEPLMAGSILGITLSSANRTKKLLRQMGDKLNSNTRARTTGAGQRFRLKGIKPKNANSARNIRNRLNALGIGYTLGPNGGPGGPNGGGGRSTSGSSGGTSGGRTDSNGLPIDENGKPDLSRIRLEDLNEEQRRALAAKMGVRSLRLVDRNKTVEEVLAETGDITKTEQYAELLGKAQALEREIEEEYKAITGKLDEQISEAERTVGAEFAAKLQEKKARELKNTAVFMSKPLSEKDIYRAMQNYKSKVPQFSATGELSQADMTGITKEINAILEQRGEGISMTEDFVRKVEKELTANQRKANEEKERKAGNNSYGQDVSSKGNPGSAVAEDVHEMGTDGKKRRKSLKDQVKEESAPDLYNPNSENNRNAPKQNAGGSKESESSATERLVKNIVNASRGSTGKEAKGSTVNQKHLEFTKKLEELDRLSKQMGEITGDYGSLDLDEVFRRLAAL